MSTLRVTNLADTSGGNSATTEQIKSGIAKAWVNFNGTGTVAIRASFNVSSITDNGTGKYSVNFTTALADANYAVNGVVANTGNAWVTSGGEYTRGASGLQQWGLTVPTTSSCRIETLIGASSGVDGGNSDFSAVYVTIFR